MPYDTLVLHMSFRPVSCLRPALNLKLLEISYIVWKLQNGIFHWKWNIPKLFEPRVLAQLTLETRPIHIFYFSNGLFPELQRSEVSSVFKVQRSIRHVELRNIEHYSFLRKLIKYVTDCACVVGHCQRQHPPLFEIGYRIEYDFGPLYS